MVPLSLTYSLLMSCDCLLEGADSISFDVDRLSMAGDGSFIRESI